MNRILCTFIGSFKLRIHQNFHSLKHKHMKTGKFVKLMTAALFVFFSLSASASTITSDSSIVTTNEIRVQQMTERLQEIKVIDKSSLTKSEKKELRKEVVEIKKEMKVISGGVYVSIGALLLILILLIILL